MFCMGCGKEIPNEARFCPHCGTAALASGSTSAPPIAASGSTTPIRHLVKGKRLWWLHTFDWQGICPVCNLIHTAETARCPNDNAPLVVAFDARRYDPFEFPIHTAEIRCSNDCGFRTPAIACTNDNTIIANSNISFRMSVARTIFHNIWHFAIFFIGSVIALAVVSLLGFSLYGLYKIHVTKDEKFLIYFIIFAFCSFVVIVRHGGQFIDLMVRCFAEWWLFRRTFRFDEAMRARGLLNKLEARDEAVQTAEYVERHVTRKPPDPPSQNLPPFKN